jgi:hypothetical protein
MDTSSSSDNSDKLAANAHRTQIGDGSIKQAVNAHRAQMSDGSTTGSTTGSTDPVPVEELDLLPALVEEVNLLLVEDAQDALVWDAPRRVDHMVLL